MYSNQIVHIELAEYNRLLHAEKTLRGVAEINSKTAPVPIDLYQKIDNQREVLEKIIKHCKENERYIGNEGVKQILREANLY